MRAAVTLWVFWVKVSTCTSTMLCVCRMHWRVPRGVALLVYEVRWCVCPCARVRHGED